MPQGRKQHAIIISQVPLVRNGIDNIFQQYFSHVELSYCWSSNELTPGLLREADFIVADLSGDADVARGACQHFCSLLYTQAKRCIFFVPREIYPLAVELLMRPGCTLLSTAESVEGIISAIRLGSEQAETANCTLSAPLWQSEYAGVDQITLTLSERQVLRLLGKGWCINQIAVMLKKSNKTISAQKNSAMRRLALRSNAEMYAWITSAQGKRELNFLAINRESVQV